MQDGRPFPWLASGISLVIGAMVGITVNRLLYPCVCDYTPSVDGPAGIFGGLSAPPADVGQTQGFAQVAPSQTQLQDWMEARAEAAAEQGLVD